MSYDLRISVKVEGLDKYVPIAYPEYDDPTYNLRDMFVACMGWNYEQGKYYNCLEIMGFIDAGINNLTFHREEYKKYNPENGWGNIDDALEALRSLKECIYSVGEDIPIEHLYMSW